MVEEIFIVQFMDGGAWTDCGDFETYEKARAWFDNATPRKVDARILACRVKQYRIGDFQIAPDRCFDEIHANFREGGAA